MMQGSDILYTRMTSHPLYNYKDTAVDSELEHKVKKVTDKHSEIVNIIANEPSLALYRIQEHIRKTLPWLVDQKHEVDEIQARVQGACFDADYASNAVRAMQSSTVHFQNIQDLLKNALFMKQQINYDDNRRKQGRTSIPTTPVQSDAGRETDTDKESSTSGIIAENGQIMDSSSDSNGCLQNEAVNFPEKSSDDSDENREVEMIMSRP